jgi:hypothetical protein
MHEPLKHCQGENNVVNYLLNEDWQEIVMLSVFGDESIDATQQKVFAVAGLLGDESQWSNLRAIWVERTGGKVFHASDCESDHGEFKNTPHEENLRLYKDLSKILANSKLIGFGVAIDLAGCYRYFPDILEEQPYLTCFLRTVKYLSEKAALCIPASKIEFTFDSHRDYEHTAGLIYQYLRIHRDWEPYDSIADKVSFASKDNVGIQAGDLWAREVMKYLEWELYRYAQYPRRSWTALYETHRFGADFIMEGFYKGLREKMPTLEKQAGISRDSYQKWLRKRQDNQSNRIEYLMCTEETDQKAKSANQPHSNEL